MFNGLLINDKYTGLLIDCILLYASVQELKLKLWSSCSGPAAKSQTSTFDFPLKSAYDFSVLRSRANHRLKLVAFPCIVLFEIFQR
jgi:hypothetical protein